MPLGWEEHKIAENQASTNSAATSINSCTGDEIDAIRLDNKEKLFNTSLSIIEEQDKEDDNNDSNIHTMSASIIIDTQNFDPGNNFAPN